MGAPTSSTTSVDLLLAAVTAGEVLRAADGSWSWEGRDVTGRVRTLTRSGQLSVAAGRLALVPAGAHVPRTTRWRTALSTRHR